MRRALGVWLAVALTLGAATAPEVWAATYFVDVTTGNDANTAAAAQSALTPWKTLTRALDGTVVDGLPNPELAAGDVINVAAGTHDTAAGETFPLFLVSGVTILGAGAGSTTILAPDGTPNFFNEDTPLVATTRLSAVTLANAGAVTEPDEGLVFEQSGANTMAPEIDNVTFDATLDDGVQVTDDGPGDGVFTGLIRNNTFNVADDGVDFSQTSSGGGTGTNFSPTIRNNTFANGSDGVLVGIVSSSSSSGGEGTFSPVVRNNTFTSADDGVAFAGFTLTLGDVTVAPLISTNTFTGVGEDAVDFEFSTISLGPDTLTVSPTIVDNTITTPGDQGIEIDIGGLCCGHVVSDLLITGNTITAPTTVGVDIALTSLAGDIDLGWTIANNTVSAAGVVGIFMGFSENSSIPSGTMDITIAGNTVTDPGALGVWFALFSQSSMTGSLDLTIAGNTVTGAALDGIRLDISTMSYLSAMGVAVRDNFADGNLVGIAVDVASTPGEPAVNPTLVTCNTATDNTGVGIVQSSLTSLDATADYGGGDQSSPGLNTLTGNGDFDFVNLAVPAVKAESNWWGTAVPATIDANISDDEDVTPTGGAVDFDPPLLAAPTVTLAVPLVDAVAVDVAPPGASLGDTIEYTGTVTGTGQCGCASLVFSAAIPGNATVVAGSVTTSKGTVVDEDPVTVSVGHLAAAETVTVTWQVIPSSGGSLSSQGTLTCAQIAGGTLSDDPDAGGAADPTVTTLAAISILEIPTLGEWALFLLAGLLLLSGLVLLRRRRATGPVMLAALVGLLLLPGNAATAPVEKARSPRERQPPRMALVAQAAVGGDLVTLRLADGTLVAVSPANVEVGVGVPGRGARDPAARSARSAARAAGRAAARATERGHERERDEAEDLGVEALRAGKPMVARVLYDRAGAVRKIKVRLYDSTTAAQAALTEAAERAATRAQARAQRATKRQTP